MEISVLKEQSLFDIAIEATHIADHAFEIAYSNHKSISDILQAASVLNIPSVFPVYSFTDNNQELPEALPAFYDKTIDCEASFFDLAVDQSVMIENAFEIAYCNNKSISDILIAASLVKIPSILPEYFSLIQKVERPEAPVTSYFKTIDHAASFFDLAVDQSALIENAFDLAYSNNRSISDILTAATLVKIPALFPEYISTGTNIEPGEAQETLYKFTVSRDACFFDFALDYTGNNENAFRMAYNNNKSISDILLKDDIVIVASKLDRNTSIVNYYKKNGINATSGIYRILEMFRIFDNTFDNTFN